MTDSYFRVDLIAATPNPQQCVYAGMCVSILEEKGYSPASCIRAALERLKKLEESNG